jgi:hypothetical protein
MASIMSVANSNRTVIIGECNLIPLPVEVPDKMIV